MTALSAFFQKILAFFIAVLSFFGINIGKNTDTVKYDNDTFTAVTDYEEPSYYVQPDTSKYIDVSLSDSGFDVYRPYKKNGFGYQYGPSVITNSDGSIDMWYSTIGYTGQWDWIGFKRSTDGGKTWTTPKKVLSPTPNSPDTYSCCDPGVVKFGNYYYIGYTSTAEDTMYNNKLFVARSKNPDGPFEKWNGNGWGGTPAPIEEVAPYKISNWGCGEPSFVAVGDTLYIYYSYLYTTDTQLVRRTQVATADATDENWPAAITEKGIAFTSSINDDGADVKYIENYGQFVAITASKRMTDESYIKVYKSDDGINFVLSDTVKTNTAAYLHNAGLSSRQNGHINLSDDTYIAYAYGNSSTVWATRMAKINYSVASSASNEDIENSNLNIDVETDNTTDFTDKIMGITVKQHVYEAALSDGDFSLSAFTINPVYTEKAIDSKDITFYGYDSSVINIDKGTVTPLKNGSTYVTAKWNNNYDTFLITIQ